MLTGASLALAGYTSPASDQTVVITQSDGLKHSVDRAMVEQLPAVQEHILFLTGHGPEQENFTGGLLWSVLEHVRALGGDRGTRIRRAIMVTGRDGYAAVLAVAEIDPDFEGKQVLLAYRQNGKLIPLRLVVPGDRYGGRSVRDVVRIELR
ncbi:MAG: molybdopterin-dependent oxidoreductase [Alphaproteobacteria bacterium]|nr:molybdopterin-dependent oxidoreductase [Alphaproteobacteria bacterium]